MGERCRLAKHQIAHGMSSALKMQTALLRLKIWMQIPMSTGTSTIRDHAVYLGTRLSKVMHSTVKRTATKVAKRDQATVKPLPSKL
jgi:hypothetical protein